MASKHSAKHTQKTAIKFVPIVAVIAAVVVLICIVVAKRPSQEDRAVEDKPILEVLQDDTSSDDGVAKDSDAISTWINRLNDEQKAELDIAYEASVKDGYKGSLDEWVATEVQAHLNDSGNVVVVLPDGGEFTVEKPSSSQDGQQGDQQSDQHSDADAADTPSGEEQPGGEQEGESPAPSQEGTKSALLSVDTVVAHKGDKRVAVPIKILGNPGALGLTFSVSYDESAVTLMDVENGKAFEGTLALTHSRTYASGCLFTWDGVDIKPEQVKDGTALTLFFDVANDASGLHAIAVRGASAYDADLGSISLTTQDGSIVIE